MRLKVLLPDGTIKKFSNDAKRRVADGSLTIIDPNGKELASFAKGTWTAVGRMRMASEGSDEE